MSNFVSVFFFRLLSIAEETLTEFLSKATGTAVEWVQMPGMKVFLCPFFPLNVKLCLSDIDFIMLIYNQ